MKNITVIGAGTMGNGIAHVFAMNGFDVLLCDIDNKALDLALQKISRNLERMVQKSKLTQEQAASSIERINTNTSLVESCSKADLVIEAVSENEDLKCKLFKQLDESAPPTCILASNTSSISITKIASATKRSDKVIGMHFMNPVPIMKLVEIINGYDTSAETTASIVDICQSINKSAVVVRDYPGFIANRVLMPMINEAIHCLQEGVAGVAQIDTIMQLGMAHPMGPLQLADFIGLDVCKSIMDVLYEGMSKSKYAPSPLLKNMVLADKLGRKTKEGFYTYSDEGKVLKVSSQFE